MTTLQLVWLAIIQGLTEFLPVSSLAYHGSEGDNESYIDTARRRARGQ